MAKQRYVNTKFWDDGYIRSLSPNGKFVYLYLCTGPLANLAGAYEITLDRMAWDTGLPEIEIDSWLQKFEADGKAIFRDSWVVVLNTIKYQKHTTPTIRTAIESLVSDCPQWIKDRLCIKYGFLSHLNLNLNLNSNLNSNGETPVAATAAADPDPVERRIWKDGVEMLVRDRMTEAQARPLLGRLVKQYSKPSVAEAIAATQAENPADTRAFLIGVLKKRNKDKAVMQVGSTDALPDGFGDKQWDACTQCGSYFCIETGSQACRDRVKTRQGNGTTR